MIDLEIWYLKIAIDLKYLLLSVVDMVESNFLIMLSKESAPL